MDLSHKTIAVIGLGYVGLPLAVEFGKQRPVIGFEISDNARAPVNVGDLKVQLITEYRSPTMVGKVLRIENTGEAPMVLREELIAGDGAIAVTISNPNLASGQATAAYVVVPAGR